MQAHRLAGGVNGVDPTAPATAWLHPSRRIGAGYGALAGVVLAVVVVAAVSYLGSGRILLAVVTAGGGLGVSAFLTVLALALLVPGLHVSATGVTGRLAHGRRVDVSWDEVIIDVPENAPPGRLQLAIVDDAIEIDVRSWAGFAEFVFLVASTPGPARQLTPAARRELGRLIGLEPAWSPAHGSS